MVESVVSRSESLAAIFWPAVSLAIVSQRTVIQKIAVRA